LVLVTMGVYSVIAYTISRQTHEIGIRMALGARRSDVPMIVLRLGPRLVSYGVVAGLALSFAASRLLANQLWGVSAYDPFTLSGVVGIVVFSGLTACYFPARRAAAIDPMVALMHE
jgi:putative ABC transport system permease protein